MGKRHRQPTSQNMGRTDILNIKKTLYREYTEHPEGMTRSGGP